MSSTGPNPQQGIAHAVNDLGEQTAILVRQEVEAVKEEMAARARALVPAAGLAAVAVGGAFFAGASSYRLVVHIPERILGPVLGPALAAGGFAAVSVLAGREALRMAREAPAPVPAATARATRSAVEDTADSRRG